MVRRAIALSVVLGLVIPCLSDAPSDPLDAERLAELRERGPAGLKVLLDEHAALAQSVGPNHASTRRLSDAIDRVAAQRDAARSHLYWYTDLDRAKAVARREGKPILSLRLLGRLDEELSCANSRFFRTTLYPDPRVGALLRDKFILHWSSERPVPVVTVDFGDGRTMKRTITGNSVHYVLDGDGRPIDAVPGLYSASAFVRALEASLELAATKPGDEELRAWHARASARLADQPANIRAEPFAREVDRAVRAKADPPPARDAGQRAVSKFRVEDPLLVAIAGLQNSIAQDTQRNEYDFHARIHRWFAAGEVRDLQSFNQRVYTELFLTPPSDPWLGLAPADAFPAIEGGGFAQR